MMATEAPRWAERRATPAPMPCYDGAVELGVVRHE
jgi:hypothetical protein